MRLVCISIHRITVRITFLITDVFGPAEIGKSEIFRLEKKKYSNNNNSGIVLDIDRTERTNPKKKEKEVEEKWRENN